MTVFWASFALLARLWPRTPIPLAAAADRLALAARLALWPAALVFALTIIIGSGRFFRGFTDPLAGNGDNALEIDRRVLTNTLEQSFVFAIALAALAARLPAAHLHLAEILTLLFMVGRIAFWIGYHVLPERRAAGMGMTYSANLVALALAAAGPILLNDP